VLRTSLSVQAFCDPAGQRWAFEATVYKSQGCRGFVGFGDADPTNVSPVVRGAEMRMADARAVNRALRKAYGIGICSIEKWGCPAHNFGANPADLTSCSAYFAKIGNPTASLE